MKTFFALFTFIMALPGLAIADNTFDQVFRFLQNPGSPYAASLGGNLVSLPHTDVNAHQINPAYLNKQKHRNFGISYMNYISDINTGSTSGAYHIPSYGTFAAGIRYVHYGDFTRIDAGGTENGSFSSYDFAFSGGWGYPVTENLQGGLMLQVLHSSYDTFRSSALAFSGGLHYTLNEQTHAGLTANHAGRQLTYFSEENEPLPFDIRAGISRKLEHLPLRLTLGLHSLHQWDMPVHQDEEEPGVAGKMFRHMNIGGEFIFTENFQLRIGYNHREHEDLKADNRIDFAGLGLGVGIYVNRFRLDVSHNNYSDVGGLTQLSVQMRL